MQIESGTVGCFGFAGRSGHLQPAPPRHRWKQNPTGTRVPHDWKLSTSIPPSSALSGTTFAIVAKIYAQRMEDLGRNAGRAGAVNTVGAIQP